MTVPAVIEKAMGLSVPTGMRMLFSPIASASCKKGNHMQIAGSSAIVVGGAGGLGEATVRRLHGAGAKVVVADLADDKGKELQNELGVRYVRTDATSEESVNAAIAEATSLAPLRISVDIHGGPASGGRLIGKDGSPLDLDGFKKTIE
ncbi:MAG: hypothetical protein QOF66_720, partial [Mycobacterium sp.]|nr:hypothetical protein [Mycobacterium sp.]